MVDSKAKTEPHAPKWLHKAKMDAWAFIYCWFVARILFWSDFYEMNKITLFQKCPDSCLRRLQHCMWYKKWFTLHKEWDGNSTTRFNFGNKQRKNPQNHLASYPQSFLSYFYSIPLKNSWRILFTFSKWNLGCLIRGHLSHLFPPPVYFSGSNDSAVNEIWNIIFSWLNVKH